MKRLISKILNLNNIIKHEGFKDAIFDKLKRFKNSFEIFESNDKAAVDGVLFFSNGNRIYTKIHIASPVLVGDKYTAYNFYNTPNFVDFLKKHNVLSFMVFLTNEDFKVFLINLKKLKTIKSFYNIKLYDEKIKEFENKKLMKLIDLEDKKLDKKIINFIKGGK